MFRVLDAPEAGTLALPVDYWRARSRAEPDSSTARSRLSLALLEAGRRDEARDIIEASIARGDADAASYEQLGTLALIESEHRLALDALEQSIARDPTRPIALNNLIWLLATSPDEALRDSRAAVRYAKALLAAGHRDASCLDTIAAAFAAAGEFDVAVRHAARSLALYESAGSAAEHSGPTRRRLDGYRAGRAFVDAPD